MTAQAKEKTWHEMNEQERWRQSENRRIDGCLIFGLSRHLKPDNGPHARLDAAEEQFQRQRREAIVGKLKAEVQTLLQKRLKTWEALSHTDRLCEPRPKSFAVTWDCRHSDAEDFVGVARRTY